MPESSSNAKNILNIVETHLLMRLGDAVHSLDLLHILVSGLSGAGNTLVHAMYESFERHHCKDLLFATSSVAVTWISHAGRLVNNPAFKYLIINDATLFNISSLSSFWDMLAHDEVSIIVLGSFEPLLSASARSLYLCGGISFEGHFLHFQRLQLEQDKVLRVWREKLEKEMRLEAIVRRLINLLMNSSVGHLLR
ncbi:hypothetical protein BT96DRAFT_991561 [Gymnopus androsaceus JB14]|uniref:Uncharacterized protein n=1 Tax=Gymnopus androsaceus JB14 TaxID=1447944 RepID=A0A6A4HZ78_9AGAR|nr:hypothetical protein BT96DRAFT_991561 [Gymnopus androsaceus JB14]